MRLAFERWQHEWNTCGNRSPWTGECILGCTSRHGDERYCRRFMAELVEQARAKKVHTGAATEVGKSGKS